MIKFYFIFSLPFIVECHCFLFVPIFDKWTINDSFKTHYTILVFLCYVVLCSTFDVQRFGPSIIDDRSE